MSEPSRRVLITGASSGIGSATARLLDRRGNRLALLARSAEGLEETRSSLTGDAETIIADVTDREALEAAVGRATEALGGLDAVVVGAAGTAFGPFREIDAEDFDRTIATTLTGAVDTIRAALEPVERSGGTIVVVGSVAGRVPLPLMSPYVTAKHGLRGLVRSLRIELRAAGSEASICLVDPGPVDSPFWRHVRSFDGLLPARIHGAYRPEDVAREIEMRIERGGGDSSIGAAMEAWRVLDLLVPPLTERVMGWAGAFSLGLKRESAKGEADALAGATGSGAVNGGWLGRPSALVAARSGLARFGVRL